MSLRTKLTHFFSAQPTPPVALQLSASFWSGLTYSAKERKVKRYSVLPLPAGIVEPHFDRPNIKDPAALSEIISEELKKLHYGGEKAACLIPESCFRIFIFSFDSLSSLESEREKLVRWRVKKQMPILPEDIRLSYQAMKLNSSVKVIGSLARTAILKEYENLLLSRGVKIGVLTAPTLSLLNLVDWQKGNDCLIANIEDDSMSLVVIINSEITLYRLKHFALDRTGSLSQAGRLGEIIKEIENTAHFIEDREKREIQSLWLHSSWGESQQILLAEMGKKLSFPVHPVDASLLVEAGPLERSVLTPLVGQIH